MTARATTIAKRSALAAALTAVLLATGALIGCDQGEGSRCQLDEDCKSGLVCNQATETCQATGGGDIDAAVVPVIDAPPEVDAAPDVPPVDVLPDA